MSHRNTPPEEPLGPSEDKDRTDGGWSYTAAADVGRVRGGIRREHPRPPRISHTSDRRPAKGGRGRR